MNDDIITNYCVATNVFNIFEWNLIGNNYLLNET